MKVLLLSILAIFCFGDLYKVGDKITFIDIKNQFDKQYLISEDIKKVIISSSKDMGDILTKYMVNNTNYQEQTKSLMYMNVYKALNDNFFLSIMFNTVKIKELQSRDYSLGLIKEEEISKKIPVKDEHFTILDLDNNFIKKIYFQKNID